MDLVTQVLHEKLGSITLNYLGTVQLNVSSMPGTVAKVYGARVERESIGCSVVLILTHEDLGPQCKYDQSSWFSLQLRHYINFSEAKDQIPINWDNIGDVQKMNPNPYQGLTDQSLTEFGTTKMRQRTYKNDKDLPGLILTLETSRMPRWQGSNDLPSETTLFPALDHHQTTIEFASI